MVAVDKDFVAPKRSEGTTNIQKDRALPHAAGEGWTMSGGGQTGQTRLWRIG